MDKNAKFLNMYNRLDNYLQGIVKVSGNVNLISYLERILPEQQRSECKTIREFKNTIESHGVNPGGVKPTVPEEWVKWLHDMLAYCKKNKAEVARKVQSVYDSSKKTGAGKKEGGPNYATSGSGYSKPNAPQVIESPIVQKIRRKLKEENNWPARSIRCVQDAIYDILEGYDDKKIAELQKYYGCKPKSPRFKKKGFYTYGYTKDEKKQIKRSESISKLETCIYDSLSDDELDYLVTGKHNCQ